LTAEKDTAVADDADPKDPAEGTDGQSELDAALAELGKDTGTAPKAEKPKEAEKQPDRLATVEKRLADWERAQAAERTETGIKSVVGQLLKNETISSVYDEVEVRALLEHQATTDERLVTAFANRHRNPQAWAVVQRDLEKQLATRAEAKVQPKGGRSATEAVRGISTSAPRTETSQIKPQSEIAKMSDGEFQRYVASLPEGAA
jgi:hypothetical protein